MSQKHVLPEIWKSVPGVAHAVFCTTWPTVRDLVSHWRNVDTLDLNKRPSTWKQTRGIHSSSFVGHLRSAKKIVQWSRNEVPKEPSGQICSAFLVDKLCIVCCLFPMWFRALLYNFGMWRWPAAGVSEKFYNTSSKEESTMLKPGPCQAS